MEHANNSSRTCSDIFHSLQQIHFKLSTALETKIFKVLKFLSRQLLILDNIKDLCSLYLVIIGSFSVFCAFPNNVCETSPVVLPCSEFVEGSCLFTKGPYFLDEPAFPCPALFSHFSSVPFGLSINMKGYSVQHLLVLSINRSILRYSSTLSIIYPVISLHAGQLRQSLVLKPAPLPML